MLSPKKHLSWLLMLPLLLLFPAEAFAIFADPPAGDVSIKLFLSQLFGSALPGALGAGGQDPLGAMFGIFNGGMLIVGGIIAAYTLVVGTMQTAHDGEMLGKQWSSLWVPIRTVLGIGMVVPLGNGYCVAQYLVMWLTVQSVGLADSLWTVFVNDYLKQAAVNVSAPNPNLRELASNALLIQVCMKSSNKLLQDEATNPLFFGTTTKVTEITPSLGGAVGAAAASKLTLGLVGPATYGTEYGLTSLTNSDMCGSITRVADLNNAAAASMLAIGAGAGGGLGLLGVSFMDAPLDVAPIYAAHRTARDAMMTEYDALAQQIVDQQNPSPGAFDTAIVNYVNSVKSEALNTAGAGDAALDTIANNASENGWMLAGAWYAKIASITNKINTAIRSVETSMVNKEEILDNSSLSGEYVLRDIEAAATYINQSEYAKVLGGAVDLGITKQVKADGQTGGVTQKLVQKILKEFTDVDIARLANDPRHPLIVVQEMGESILSWISIGVVGMMVISVVPGVGALVAPILGLIVFAAWASAVIMAIYTPLLPFVIFLGAVVGWMILVIEAMIAAPIWAVMHLSPSGNDFMGNAKSGYTLLLSLLLRPALIVIGFAAAVIIAYPIGYLLNAVFFDAFFLSMGESGTMKGLFTTIAAMVVYASLILSLLHRAFSLIHVVPDQILRWFGAGDSTIGKHASEMGSEGKVGVAAMGAVGHQAGQDAGRWGPQMRQYNETKRGAVAQEEANRANRISGIQTARESAQEAMEAADVAAATAQQTGLPSDALAAQNALALATRRADAAQSMEASAAQRGYQVPPNTMPYAQGRSRGNSAPQSPSPSPGDANNQTPPPPDDPNKL